MREKLFEAHCSVLSEWQPHPKGCFQQPRARSRGWANKVGPEGPPCTSNQPLLVGAGMPHNLHHESVRPHLEQHKRLPFPNPTMRFFFSPEFRAIASKACGDLFPRSWCRVQPGPKSSSAQGALQRPVKKLEDLCNASVLIWEV